VLGCRPCGGPCTCVRARLLSAKESVFHDRTLIDATRKIQAILDGIEPREGFMPSFLSTRMGIFLAWVEEGAGDPNKGVTAMDDDATVAAALGLIDWQSDQEQGSAL
jgi:hypothetical protein